MKNSLLQRAAQFYGNRRRSTIRRWGLGILACAVVVCTVSVLIQPAATLEKEPLCGLEAHEHTESCYAEETVRPAPEFLCCESGGLGETVVHTHSEYCYDPSGELICPLAEVTEHRHSEDCCETGRALVCEEVGPEHLHGEDCYEAAEELVCGREEVVLHTHEGACYDENGSLICGMRQVLAHQHDASCIAEPAEEPEDARVPVCGLEAHTHTDGCCPETQGAAYTCGLKAHSHDETCLDETGGLACGLPEHVHSEDCRTADRAGQRELTCTGADYTVRVSYGKEAALPEGVTLSVREIEPGSAEYERYCGEARTALKTRRPGGGERMLFARFFDVRFLLDGQEAEPAGPVSVTITYAEAVEASGDEISCQAIHFAEDGPELLKAETAEDPDSGTTSFTHVQDSFSVLGSLVTVYMANPADIGPDSLPVDYYVCINDVWTRVGATRTGWYHTWNGTEGWNDYNRDYITVDQAVSVLGEYGFTGAEENPARKVAYQQKTGNTNIFSDTGTVEIGGVRVIPLSRNANGFHLYYLPGNTQPLSGVSAPELLDRAGNGFYTVTVSGQKGETLTSGLVRGGGTFTWDASGSGVTGWLAAYDDGRRETLSGETLSLTDITSAVHVSPYQGETNRHGVTFKALIDGSWQKVGSLPYYYSDNGRAWITSDMAAQFFGPLGYTAETEPGLHFGYSYDDIYTVRYGSEPAYCMDVKDGIGNIKDGTPVQLYSDNGTDAQVFRIWGVNTDQESGEGFFFITPITDSRYHVNVLGGGTADGRGLALHSAVDKASWWKVTDNGDGTVSFYNGNAPDRTAISLPGGNAGSGVQLRIDSGDSGRRWRLDQKYRISNDTDASREADGTWRINLTAEDTGDIVCCYMPGADSAYKDAGEDAIWDADSQFWSVKVVDESQGVYTVAQQEAMTQYVKNGGSVTVTVDNAEGVLWACRGMKGQPVTVRSSQRDGRTTFEIAEITQPVEVTATRTDPAFTVQYYAWMDTAAASGAKELDVIDTSGGNLPRNYSTWVDKNQQGAPQPAKRKTIYLNSDGRLATAQELREVYRAQTYRYETSPGLRYVNKLAENGHYELREIWVLKAGRDPASTAAEDWTVYKGNAAETILVNSVPQASNEIMVTDAMVLRLVYQESSDTYINGVNFYDYDISDGSYVTGVDSKYGMQYQMMQTAQSGINSAGNYSGSGVKLAFGNRNAGVDWQDQIWQGSSLNHYNASVKSDGSQLDMTRTRGYKGCTFGLVTGLKNGMIQYASGVDAPKLFNESGKVTGKTAFDSGEFNLRFSRVGDTYTLMAVDTADGKTAAGDLDRFDGELGSNNFWPMDAAPTWGNTDNGHDFKFGSKDLQHARRFGTGYWNALPVSDDGQDHNSYFGMQYAVNFSLTEDYTGPLEYYFYGDDDMWVFLDDQLVCDIGGVHSTVGEYVNLWDYIRKGTQGTHTLSFFYTERGASGSTCYMRFTLPSVSGATTSRDVGQLQIGKTLAEQVPALDDAEYEFRVDLLTEEKGMALRQTFSYKRSNGTYGTVASGGTIRLKSGETALISGLPAGSYYTVTELTTKGYQTTVNGSAGIVAAGTIASGGTAPANFVNTPYYELPATGGATIRWYTMGGLCLVALAGLLYSEGREKQSRRKEGI